MEKFLELLLGSNDVPTYCAAFVFAIIGQILSLRVGALSRNKLSHRTPYKFSWRFLMLDNLQRLAVAVLVTFVIFRFSTEYLGKEATLYLSIGFGATADQMAAFIVNRQKKARK